MPSPRLLLWGLKWWLASAVKRTIRTVALQSKYCITAIRPLRSLRGNVTQASVQTTQTTQSPFKVVFLLRNRGRKSQSCDGKEGNPPILSEREFRRENLCAAFLFVFKCVCVYIYIFESIREDQLFQGSSVCTSGARAAAVWIKQAGSFPVLHTATTAASNRVLWQVYNWSFVTLSCRWVVQLHWIQARLWPCIHERWVEAYLLNISVLNATLL